MAYRFFYCNGGGSSSSGIIIIIIIVFVIVSNNNNIIGGGQATFSNVVAVSVGVVVVIGVSTIVQSPVIDHLVSFPPPHLLGSNFSCHLRCRCRLRSPSAFLVYCSSSSFSTSSSSSSSGYGNWCTNLNITILSHISGTMMVKVVV